MTETFGKYDHRCMVSVNPRNYDLMNRVITPFGTKLVSQNSLNRLIMDQLI